MYPRRHQSNNYSTHVKYFLINTTLFISVVYFEVHVTESRAVRSDLTD